MEHADVIIIGAGPAGLAAALYAGRANLSTLVLEETGLSGGQGLNIPEIENYPGLFPAKTGLELAEALENQARGAGAAFESARVLKVRKEGPAFIVAGEKKTYTARTVILASGGSPKKLGIPGEAAFTGRGVSYCAACDGPFFRAKAVAVVGGGNSACDEAVYLGAIASQVTLIHRRDAFRADPAAAARAINHPKISVKYNTVVSEIRGKSKVTELLLKDVVTGQQDSFPVEGVFIFAGFVPRTACVADLGVKTDPQGYILTGEDMAASVPGLFCAGDCRAKPLRQLITAAADGAVAAHSAGKFLQTSGL